MTAEGLGPKIRLGQGPVRPRRGWPQNQSGTGPREAAEGQGPRIRLGQGPVGPEGLGPEIRVGQGPVKPPRGRAPESDWGSALCDPRG